MRKSIVPATNRLNYSFTSKQTPMGTNYMQTSLFLRKIFFFISSKEYGGGAEIKMYSTNFIWWIISELITFYVIWIKTMLWSYLKLKIAMESNFALHRNEFRINLQLSFSKKKKPYKYNWNQNNLRVRRLRRLFLPLRSIGRTHYGIYMDDKSFYAINIVGRMGFMSPKTPPTI